MDSSCLLCLRSPPLPLPFTQQHGNTKTHVRGVRFFSLLPQLRPRTSLNLYLHCSWKSSSLPLARLCTWLPVKERPGGGEVNNRHMRVIGFEFEGGGGDGRSGGGGNSHLNSNGWNPFEFNGRSDSDLLIPFHLYLWNKRDHHTNFTNNDNGFPFFLLSFLVFFCHLGIQPAFAMMGKDVVWEVRGGKWFKFTEGDDDILVDSTVNTKNNYDNNLGTSPPILLLLHSWKGSRDLLMRLMLPEGYPRSVSNDYLEYSLWRAVQGIASQINGVLTTQALLYAVGLGKGAIPTAAAVNWILKDGIGYLSKILLSKYGRHFDENPKGWRLFADLMENAAYGMELLTPAFPHLFVLIGAVAGAGRSASALIQAATRSCFYAGFAVQRNFAEVIAKGEAQGMVSKSLGIMIGIGLSNYIGTSTPLLVSCFTIVTAIHMFCNLKSYQSIQLRTLNPYRASLVFSEYLLSGQVPSVKEVNYEEPLFLDLSLIRVQPENKDDWQMLSWEAKNAAVQITSRLQLGSKLSEIVSNKEDAYALLKLFMDEGYLLAEHKGKFCIVLKVDSSPQDMLKSLYHVSYLYWLEKHAGIRARNIVEDCREGGRLQISLDYVHREFVHAKNDSELAGWVTDGLIARPLPTRICLE